MANEALVFFLCGAANESSLFKIHEAVYASQSNVQARAVRATDDEVNQNISRCLPL